MAFTQTIDKQGPSGDLKRIIGHFVLTGVTTGELDLSGYCSGKILSVVLGEQQYVTTPSSQTQNLIMNETFPLAASTTITINGPSGAKATFIALAEGE